MANESHTLYVAPHGLGDLIMSIRAIEFLAEKSEKLSVMVKGENEANYLTHSTSLVLNDVLIVDEYRKKNKLLFALSLIWRLKSGGYSIAVPQMNVNQSYLKYMLAWGGVKSRETSLRVLQESTLKKGSGYQFHKVDMNVEMAAKILGISPPNKPSQVWPSREIRDIAAPKIALAPGSGEVESHKRWPVRNYAKLARLIRAKSPRSKILIFGSPSEKGICAEIEAESGGAAIVSKTSSTTDLYDAMLDIDICIANCNGASHVASHAGATVVGLFGPTQASHTGPHCDRLITVSRHLACSPCYQRDFITGCGNPICMTGLEVSVVSEVVLGLLSNQSKQ